MSAFDDKVKDLIAGTNRLADDEVKRVQKLLKRTQEQIASRLVATPWQAHRVPQIQKAVEKSMDQFAEKYSKTLMDSLSSSWEFGLGMVEDAGITAIPQSTLEILQGYSADRITNMTGDVISKINDEIAVGITSGQTLQEVMQKIGNNLTDPGVFRSIAGRAETIARTEIATVQSNAREARAQEVMRLNPEMKYEKQWFHSNKSPAHSRMNHRRIDKVIVPIDKDFSKSGGRQPVPKGHGLPYPHAPGLPAKEVINCGCVHIVKLVPGQEKPIPKPVPVKPEKKKKKPKPVPPTPKKPKGVKTTADGRDFVKDKFSSEKVMIEVDLDKLDEGWKKDINFYLPKKGEGLSEIKGRREGFEDWMKKNPDTPIESPVIHYDPRTGKVSFVDGRHRTSVLRDQGDNTIFVSVDKKIAKDVRKDLTPGK